MDAVAHRDHELVLDRRDRLELVVGLHALSQLLRRRRRGLGNGLDRGGGQAVERNRWRTETPVVVNSRVVDNLYTS